MALVDPLWAIVSDPVRRNGRWAVEEFFRTGEAELANVLGTAQSLGYPRAWEEALDFGCGIGRITRSMSKRFSKCTGVDISEVMLKQASEINSRFGNCRFVVNSAPDLRQFPAQTFDFVYSSLVLQHLPNEALARRYIIEFLRVVRPGGLVVFQMPYLIPWRNRLQVRRRLYNLLRRFGFGSKFLYRRARLNPIRMIAIPEPEVRRLVEMNGGIVGLAQLQDAPAEPIRSLRYYVCLLDRQ